MALIMDCRFCGGNSVNHDHDECGVKYENALTVKFLEHLKSGKPLTETFLTEYDKEIKTEKYRFYLDYLERKKSREEVVAHMEKIKNETKKICLEILSLPKNKQRLRECNKELGFRSFRVEIKTEVEVDQEPRY